MVHQSPIYRTPGLTFLQMWRNTPGAILRTTSGGPSAWEGRRPRRPSFLQGAFRLTSAVWEGRRPRRPPYFHSAGVCLALGHDGLRPLSRYPPRSAFDRLKGNLPPGVPLVCHERVTIGWFRSRAMLAPKA